MFQWAPFPFVRFSLWLIIGILVYEYLRFPWQWIAVALAMLFTCHLILHIFSSRYGYFRFSMINGVSAFLVLVSLGSLLAALHDDTQYLTHYSHCKSVKAVVGKVSKEVTKKNDRYQIEIDVLRLANPDNNRQIQGKLLVHLREVNDYLPKFGDILAIIAPIHEIPEPLNPGPFDYKQYQSRQNIFAQVFATGNDIILLRESKGFGIRSFAISLKNAMIHRIHSFIKGSQERQIVTALLTGSKDAMDDELLNAYRDAGAIHILAVSGLHVGIIYLFLSKLLKPLRGQKWGRRIYLVLTLGTIWLFALITGFSASILRAATMFSLFLVGESIQREHNIYNTLGTAGFILMVINPAIIFSIGFQLSFLAVFGIVYLFPRIYELLSFDSWLGDKVWGITCVSLAAQVFTAPLVVYYFNQFPLYFLLSNLIAIPLAFIVLIAGIPLLGITVMLPELANGVGFVLETIIQGLNLGLIFIAQFPFSTWTHLHLSLAQLLLTYGLLMSLFFALHFRSFQGFLCTSLLILILVIFSYYHRYNNLERSEIRLYHLSTGALLEVLDKGNATAISLQEVTNTQRALKILNPIRMSEGYLPSDRKSILDRNTFFRCKNDICLAHLLNTTFLHLSQKFVSENYSSLPRVDVLLISNNALQQASDLEHFRFKHLIFDGSNHPRYIGRLRKQLESYNYEAHFMAIDGYWHLDMKNTHLTSPW